MSEIEQGRFAFGQADVKHSHATNVRWYIFVIVFLLVVINMVDRTALSIAMPSIATEFSLDRLCRASSSAPSSGAMP